MARLRDVRERIHQPFYDTLTRGFGVTSLTNRTPLFGSANINNRALSNMQTAGVFAADATYVLKAVRVVTLFKGLNDTEFTGSYNSAITALSNVTATNARAEDLYEIVSYGATFTLQVGNKPMLNAPLWYAPAGGGPSGTTTENSRHHITNGVPSQEAILRLARDIPVVARQNFSVDIDFFPFLRLGTGANGSTIAADIDPLLYLNQFDGLKLLQVHVDGLITRDVQ